jgi:putative membrane protein
MNSFYIIFIIRWLANSLGIWVAIQLLGSGYNDIDINISTSGVLLAGLIFSLVNSLIKPLLVVLSLPAILLTLGLFMIVVNGVLVYISLRLAPGIGMSLINSIFTGMILSLVNYIISTTLLVKSGNIR